MRLTQLSLALVLILCGCLPQSGLDSDLSSDNYVGPQSNEIRVNWLTNRSADYSNKDPDSKYSANLNPYFPPKGVEGALVNPRAYKWGQEISHDLVMRDHPTYFNKEQAFSALDRRYCAPDAKEQYCARAFVYVHGFNNKIEDAVHRMQQLSAALYYTPRSVPSYVAKPFIFSWPSAGKLVDDIDFMKWIETGYPNYARPYVRDEVMSDRSVRDLAEYLMNICAGPSRFKEVSIIAHSMGARLTTKALAYVNRSMRAQNRQPCVFKDVIFASGDMGVFSFRQYLPDLLQVSEKITLYVNATLIEQIVRSGVSADIALVFSKLFHFFQAAEIDPRIGQQGLFLKLLDSKVDIVGMKFLTEPDDRWGHYKIFSCQVVLEDMARLLNGLPNTRRSQLRLHKSSYALQACR